MSDATSTRPAGDAREVLCPGSVADLVAACRRPNGEDIVRLVSVDDQSDSVRVVLEVAKN